MTPGSKAPFSRCASITQALEKANWSVNRGNLEVVNFVIDSFRNHVLSACTCVPNVGLQYLLGNSCYELFLALLYKFNAAVAEAEDDLEDVSGKPTFSEEDLREHPPVADQCNSSKPSKFESESLHAIVNTDAHERLMAPLFKAVNFWTVAVKAGPQLINVVKTRAAEYIIAAFYTFQCYKLIDYQEKCARLLIAIAVELNDTLSAHCLMAIVYLEKGNISEARSSMEKASFYEKQLQHESPEAHERYIYMLINCELELHTGDRTKSGKRLKSFLNSSYLAKLTLNRYYIKGMAYLLATCFQVDEYEYDSEHVEFLEPIQIAVCILKRWHRSMFEKGQLDKAVTTDPIWYKFAVYSYSFNSYEIISTFCISNGQPSDLVFYHNPLLKICRQNCFIFW